MGKPGEWLNDPRKFLVIFCCLQLLIYAERGAFASNGINAVLKKEFNLSLFQDGLLPAVFMVGLLIASPIFAEAAKYARGMYLIAIGLTIWALAVFGSGLSIGFLSLLLCRMAVGVGEASFVALAAPFIDDVAPPEAKARWLAIFFLCIPSGFALGFLYGGLVASKFGWRTAFLIEAAGAIPFIILSFNAPRMMDLRGTHEQESSHEEETSSAGGLSGGQGRHRHSHSQGPSGDVILISRLKEACRDVLKLTERPLYLWVVAGMTCYTAMIGTTSYYGPQAATALFALSPRSVDLAFGGLTVFTGVVGTLSGGVLLDKWGSTLENGSLLCCLGLGTAAVFVILAFAIAKSFYMFCLIFSLGQCAMFSTMAPGNAVAMWSVPQGLRPLAMSMSVVALHVFGDVPAPPLIGLLQGKVQNWRISMIVLAIFGLVLGAGCYFIGFVVSKKAIDFRNVEQIGGRSNFVDGDNEIDGGGGGRGGRFTPEHMLLAEEEEAAP